MKIEKKYVVITRTGTNIGNGYLSRVFLSIALIRADGSKVYKGHSPYWIENRGWWAYHYKTGLSKADKLSFDAAKQELQSICDNLNSICDNLNSK